MQQPEKRKAVIENRAIDKKGHSLKEKNLST